VPRWLACRDRHAFRQRLLAKRALLYGNDMLAQTAVPAATLGQHCSAVGLVLRGFSCQEGVGRQAGSTRMKGRQTRRARQDRSPVLDVENGGLGPNRREAAVEISTKPAPCPEHVAKPKVDRDVVPAHSLPQRQGERRPANRTRTQEKKFSPPFQCRGTGMW